METQGRPDAGRDEKEGRMIARTMTLLLALVMGLSLTALGASAARDAGADHAVLSREEDLPDLRHENDDRDGGTGTGGGTGGTFNSGTGNSNDGTNSRVTAVSRDRDRSRDDLTRDRTGDGPGPVKRDWTKNHTNDGTRNDTR
jgi:hypothetical protein